MARSLVSPTGKPVKLGALHPNAALGVEYRAKLDRLIDEMHASVSYWLMAAYKGNEPEISQLAQDKSPAAALNEVMRKLALRWNRKFKQASTELALFFGQKVKDRTDAQMKAILKRGGFTVEFKMTDAANDAYQAVIAENVGLIRNIAQEHLTQVQGMVMRSVQKGRDVGGLAMELEARYGITKRRAATIARDQNAKASAVIGRVRMNEVGITTALWIHSGAGKHPRPKHLAASGTEYDINKGLPVGDNGEFQLPGEAINCRCVPRAIIPALRDEMLKRALAE